MAAILCLDQVSKLIIRRKMVVRQSIPVVSNVFHLTYIRNTGAAFSLFAKHTKALIVASILIIMLVVLSFNHLTKGHELMRFAVALVIAGALGNLIDRLRFGYVVDFIDLQFFPVFNVADMAIFIGIALLLWEAAHMPQEKGY